MPEGLILKKLRLEGDDADLTEPSRVLRPAAVRPHRCDRIATGGGHEPGHVMTRSSRAALACGVALTVAACGGGSKGAGNPGTTDSTAPTIAITSPDASVTQTGAFSVTANVADASGVADVSLRVNGSAYGPTLTAAPYEFTVTPTASGSYAIQVCAHDNATPNRNYGCSSTLSITTDLTGVAPQWRTVATWQDQAPNAFYPISDGDMWMSGYYLSGNMVTGSFVRHGLPSSWTETGGSADSIWASDPDNVFAATNGQVMRRWNGSTWTDMPQLIGAQTGSAVCGTSASNLYVVGAAGGRAVAQRWNGSSWIDLNGSGRVTGVLLAVACTSPTQFVAVGDQGLIVTWDGASLTTVESGTTDTLWSVWASAPDDVWVVGDDFDWNAQTVSGVVLRGDGTSFSTVLTDPVHGLYSVNGSGPDDVWIGGGRTDLGRGSTLKHWGGSAFTTNDSDAANWIGFIRTLGANDVWAMGWSSAGTPSDPSYHHEAFLMHFSP